MTIYFAYFHPVVKYAKFFFFFGGGGGVIRLTVKIQIFFLELWFGKTYNFKWKSV